MVQFLKNCSASVNEFSVNQLLPDITAGLVTGVISVFTSISLAAMVFSGSLDRYLAIGIGITLFSNVVIRSVVTLSSSFPGIISNPQPEQMAILALIVAEISHKLPGAPSAELLSTVVVAIALTSLLTGAFLIALGPLKISELVRYIPYPIVGGFLAGIGWLMVQGALTFMAGQHLSFYSLAFLLQPNVLVQWFPGLLFAILLLLISRRYNHYLVIPGMSLAAIALFYGILMFTQTPVATASAQGWLLGPFPQGGLWQPLTLSMVVQVNWSAVFSQFGSMLTILILSALSLLLNAIGLEVSTEQEINLNRELRVTGIANLISGFTGGMVGSHSLRSSILAYRMSGRSRLVGLVAAAVFALVLIFGSSFLSYFPRAVMGGLLIYLGLSLLVEWGYDAGFKLPRIEYYTVLLILVVISTAGFLKGIGVGLMATVLMFVIKYSRVDATRRILSGSSYQSNVDRSSGQQALLTEKGEQIYILELQGFIFFGTANNLLTLVRQRVEHANHQPLRFLVLDLRLVSGIDSSAVLSFVKIKQFAAQHQVKLVFTAVHADVHKLLARGGCLDQRDAGMRLFPDLDRGIEWCEDKILAASTEPAHQAQSITLQLEQLFDQADQAADFVRYLEKREVGKGDWVFRQGDPPDGIYFVASGQVSILLQLPDGQTRRLRAFGAGAIVGEMGAYQKTPRSASVVVDRSSCLYRLSNEALARLETEAPELATALHKFAIHSLSDRLYYVKQESQIIRPRGSHPSNPEILHETYVVHQPEPTIIRPIPSAPTGMQTLNTIDPAFKERCQRELTLYIGPLAGIILERTIAKEPSADLEQLIESLAATIPNHKEAIQFKQKLTAELHKLVAKSCSRFAPN